MRANLGQSANGNRGGISHARRRLPIASGKRVSTVPVAADPAPKEHVFLPRSLVGHSLPRGARGGDQDPLPRPGRRVSQMRVDVHVPLNPLVRRSRSKRVVFGPADPRWQKDYPVGHIGPACCARAPKARRQLHRLLPFLRRMRTRPDRCRIEARLVERYRAIVEVRLPPRKHTYHGARAPDQSEYDQRASEATPRSNHGTPPAPRCGGTRYGASAAAAISARRRRCSYPGPDGPADLGVSGPPPVPVLLDDPRRVAGANPQPARIVLERHARPVAVELARHAVRAGRSENLLPQMPGRSRPCAMSAMFLSAACSTFCSWRAKRAAPEPVTCFGSGKRANTWSGTGPVDQLEVWNSGEVCVGGNECRALNQCDGCDPDVVGRYHGACCSHACVDGAIHAGMCR